MMGNKKRSALRRELQTAIKATGQDPIAWLEERTAEAKLRGEGADILQSLQRVLKDGGKRKGKRRQRARN
jgi:hypothetical protein